MKKLILMIVTTIALLAITATSVFGGSYFWYGSYWNGYQQSNSVSKPKPTSKYDKVLNTIQQKTFATWGIFEGESDNWTANCVVDKIVEKGNSTSRMKITITPKKDYGQFVVRNTKYNVITSSGEISGEQWLESGCEIEIDSEDCFQASDETIVIEVTQLSETEYIELSNVFPSDIIDSRSALRKAFEEHYRIYDYYPTEEFTYELELLDNKTWIVSYDDNDGIGGKSVLTIDAYTGEVGDTKVEE